MRGKFGYTIIPAIVVLTTALLALSCSRKEETPVVETAPPPLPRPWAIIHTYAPEAAELLKSVSVVSDTIWAGRPVAVGWLVQPVVSAVCGAGMANAAATAQHIIDEYNPRGIILTGVSAAVNKAHLPGDVVIPDQWITHDFGYWGPEGFKLDSIPVGRAGSSGFDPMIDIPVDTQLATRLGEAANRVSYRFRTVEGRLPEVFVGGAGASGNMFIDSKLKRDWLWRELQAEIVDLESAAVVQTARAAGIPVAVMRSCSSLAGGGTTQNPQQVKYFFEVTAVNSALVLKEFLESRADGL